jgi:hypothetical protein
LADALYGRYYWVRDVSPGRFRDAGDYFETLDGCVKDAKEILDRLDLNTAEKAG